MAVSKELLARYKEMKAKGINITLAELKKQLEGVNDVTNTPETCESSSNFGVNETHNTPETYERSSNFGINETHNTPETYESSSNFGINETHNTPETYGSFSNYTSSNFSSQSGTNSINSEETPSYSTNTTSENTWTTTYYNNSSQNTYNTNAEKEYPSTNNGTYSNEYQNNFVAPTNGFSHTETTTPRVEIFQQPQYEQQKTESFNIEQPQITENSQLENNNMPDAINAPTRKYAVIGYPLGHSLSTYIHEAGFKSLGLKASYEILETPPEKLVDRIKYLKANNYSGFNVTIPLKLPILMFLNEIDVSADIVNAINTVTIDPITKELKGYNTDVLGFKNAIPQDFTLCGKVGGVLGTGGAARAAITALAQSQMKEIKLYTRNVPNSLDLVNHLRKSFPNIEFNTYQIERIRDLSDVNILVNTTPIGMQGRGADFTPVEERELQTLPKDALVYDVIYNPKKTILLKLAQKHGYRTVNGVDMFIHQAVEAEKIWTGRTPDFKDMKIAALENL